MADFTRKLQQLSVRGTPVGAEELIERIEAELAGDPLVVVDKQREGVFMTKIDESVRTQTPGPGRGLAWALAAFAVVLAVGGLYFAFSGGNGEVVDQTTVPISITVPTTAPEPQTMTDLEIVEAGVAALYSGEAETAAEVFDLPDLSDEEIRQEAAYQAAIDGRLTLNCTEGSTAGTFTCVTPYHNAMTDAVGFVDSGDTYRVVVEDGLIREFSFPEHSFLVAAFLEYLEDKLALGENNTHVCFRVRGASRTEACANVMLDNLDDWAASYQANN